MPLLFLRGWIHDLAERQLVGQAHRELEAPLDDQADAVSKPVGNPCRVLRVRVADTADVVRDTVLEMLQHLSLPRKRLSMYC